MNFTSYFLKHPVLALLLNGMIILCGVLCFNSLPLREYPKTELPVLTVRALYPNASAELVESSVVNILEDHLAGIEGLETITAQARASQASIKLKFTSKTSLDCALMAVHDAVALARSQLPKDVREPVIERASKSEGLPFMAIALESSSADLGALTHYAILNLKNSFRSLKGVASAEVWGQPYTILITLDAKKMKTFGVNGDDIYNALERSSLSLPVGKFQNDVPTTLESSLDTLENYENLVIKEKNFENENNKQPTVLLKSVANIRLGNDNQQFRIRINGHPGLCLSLQKSSDANPLNVSDDVKERVRDLQDTLPSHLKMSIVLDQAEAIRASLKNIKSSILEAVFLVLMIVFLFLRKGPATLVPLVTIPISLIGSFIFLKVCGFSLNVMTLLAMVLAVGLVVDDAIVVLENIVRHGEQGFSSEEAAQIGVQEIGFAIVAMTLTLVSVYLPIVFMEGTLGDLFLEFAVALAGSVLISGLVALTLSPLMCRYLLNKTSTPLWPVLDQWLSSLNQIYDRALNQAFKYHKIVLGLAFATFGFSWLFYTNLPREMAPSEDRGIVGLFIPPLPGKSVDVLDRKVAEIEQKMPDIKEANMRLTFLGDWGANIIFSLKPHEERSRSAADIMTVLKSLGAHLPSINAWAFSIDSGLPGLDSQQDSELALILSTTQSYQFLLDQLTDFQKKLEKQEMFESTHHQLSLDFPAYKIIPYKNVLDAVSLTPSQLARTVEIFFSGNKSLTFQKEGILYPITLEGKPHPWTLNELYLTNSQGKRISMGALAELVAASQPSELFHYNQMRAVVLKADLKPEDKIVTFMPKFWKSADQALPKSIKKQWTGGAQAYQDSNHTLQLLFILALVFIFAILAAQFDNFLDPFIIMLTVPLALSGGLFFVWALGQSFNIYTQVGFITLIGLISKHGILIVEFANQLLKEGLLPRQAVQKAAHLRLRPILMTTAAMMFGAVPLILSQNAGAEARRVIGAVLIGGLGGGTFFTLFVLPLFYTSFKSSRMNKKEGREMIPLP